MIPWLDENLPTFPPVDLALEEPDGLLAAGGNLHTQTLVNAYRQGIFPWFNEGDPILWWSPNPRCVLYPSDIHISRSLAKLIRQDKFTITQNQAFDQVVEACAQLRQDKEGTWITDDIRRAYQNAHIEGIGQSIEVWQEDVLVGGLYGLSIGSVFFGESMFSKVSNASKIAFVYLAKMLDKSGFKVIDCQVESPHLLSLGAIMINRAQFIDDLRFCEHEPRINPWIDAQQDENRAK